MGERLRRGSSAFGLAGAAFGRGSSPFGLAGAAFGRGGACGAVLPVILVAAVGCGGQGEGDGDAGAMAAAAPDTVAAELRIALTFDDLPGVAVADGGCDPAALESLTDRLLDGLRRNEAPAAALVTGSRMCRDAPPGAGRSILRAWVEAGHTLGNHTYTHPDLNAVDLDAYLADIRRNEALLDSVRTAGPGGRWFRAPFLHYGDTPAKYDGLRAYLDSAGYGIARVSVDNQEWVFADVYARAMAAGDSATMERVAGAYVPFMDSVLAFFEARTREVVGRYPPQVLLLHANELNADRLDDLIAMIRRRGYELVTMEDALADPWYAEPERYIGSRGLAWLHRLAETAGETAWPEEPREPDWLARLQRR